MSSAENRHLPFHELIEECSNMLARMDTLQLNALIERFSAEIDSRQTLNYLVDGPSLLTYLISRHVVRPDNLSALIAMAEVADRSDLKQIIGRYCHSPPSSSHPKDMSMLIDNVSEGIQNDWRNLARQLTLAEFDIANIQASTSNDQQLAASEMLDLFRRTRSHRDLVRELVTALRAIKRFSLAAKVDELVNAVPAQYA
ncbi:uncharacterized protein LOC124191559 isoform X2 [Daphnia pulex]|uniref:uncharacterized protein LOC124191559 isoform X2 n=1 Tax=Daphnia pulex TaxID=6669 RepID=UPI001EDD9C19|nr:uncharacterized protein LOC124191559 isoform X2 [Daphnia pulex]